jgi:phosphatidylglycerol:prolipoprotein diacylglycerol transferase
LFLLVSLLVHSSFLQLGHLHIPLYGLCAAVGVMAALTLCQMTARLVRLNPAKVWDAALAMMLAALVFSRVLLVIGSWRSFLMSPLLMLALPSLNDTGILLTAIFTLVYLRWKKIPLLGFLDAMSPCFALGWAFLSLGELLAGTRDGMPTESLLSMNNGGFGKVQPVELYTLVTALVLCGVLIRWLPRRGADGLGFGLGLILAGAAMFLLDLLRLPSSLFVAAMLDPVQWLGVAMTILGAALFIAMPAVAPVTAEKETNHAV